MNRRRLISAIRKEFRQLSRDRRTLRLFVIAPIVQLIMFGFAVNTDLKGVKLGVVMEEPSPQAMRLVEAVRNTHAFVLSESSDTPEDAQPWLDSGAAQITLDIPHGFARALGKGEAPAVQVLSDGADSNTATLAFQYLSGAATTWALGERVTYLKAHPQQAARLSKVPQIGLEPRFWYNPDLKSVNYQLPGVLGLVMLTITLSASSLAIVKERELGTLEQLSVTPLSAAEMLVGKTVPIGFGGLLLTLVVMLIACFGFGVPLRGSIPFLFLCAVLFLLSSTGMGLLVSVVSKSQVQAQLTASFMMTPLILLSGFLFPIANMPVWAQWITRALPTRYYMEAVRGIFLKGQGFGELWHQAAALAILGTLLYTSAIRLFHKRSE
ncbi:MAG TPA: ABC transporter permease [Armatimonadota bacterium]|jgi:ABC-2 type transport system permease protein